MRKRVWNMMLLLLFGLVIFSEAVYGGKNNKVVINTSPLAWLQMVCRDVAAVHMDDNYEVGLIKSGKKIRLIEKHPTKEELYLEESKCVEDIFLSDMSEVEVFTTISDIEILPEDFEDECLEEDY